MSGPGVGCMLGIRGMSIIGKGELRVSDPTGHVLIINGAVRPSVVDLRPAESVPLTVQPERFCIPGSTNVMSLRGLPADVVRAHGAEKELVVIDVEERVRCTPVALLP